MTNISNACPHVITSDDGTSHCELAETAVRAHLARAETAETALAAARKAETALYDFLDALVLAKKNDDVMSVVDGMLDTYVQQQAALAVPDQPNPGCPTCDGTRKVRREFKRVVARRTIPDSHDVPCPACTPDQPDPGEMTVDATWMARAVAAEAALVAISDLHTSDVLGHCLQDGFTYPCPTVRLLAVPDQPNPTGADT